MTHPKLATAMMKPAFYPECPRSVELVQTHISYVFIAGDFVYKIKKPVNFGFLDFTSLSLRKHYCEEELRLNRRLARKRTWPLFQSLRTIRVNFAWLREAAL